MQNLRHNLHFQSPCNAPGDLEEKVEEQTLHNCVTTDTISVNGKRHDHIYLVVNALQILHNKVLKSMSSK